MCQCANDIPSLQLRQQRKEDLERHVAEVNRMLRQANPDLESSSDDEGEWNGIEDGDGGQTQEVVDHEEEYVDEDKYTTVTVETVDIDRDGFKTKRTWDEDGDEDQEDEEDEEGREAGKEAEGKVKAKGKRVWTAEKPKSDKPKRKKKKFRYESKTERKVTRDKQKAKNRTQAEARKARGK